MGSYAAPRYEYVIPPELRGSPGARRPVVVVGAGPVGLAAAIDLAIHGIPCLVLDDNDTVSVGSRAICWAKRTLEIFDRLGVGDRMVAKGVTWQRGRVHRGDEEIYSFDLLPEGGHKMPAFINLQQYYVEEYLVERARDFPDLLELRWRNEVTGVSARGDGVVLEVATPDGSYRIEADWVLAADGANSALRRMLGLPFEGQAFEERFLIADVRMRAPFPNERLFWFRPSFHPGQSALLHRQPDDVFRIDFQLGPEADPVLERQPQRVIPRVRAVVGESTPFELEWCSVYAFRCARLERFVHGRVVFVGDSAHVVSPFGARGGNGGIQDVDNLCWKLARVVQGRAPESLVATYDGERRHGADENILNSSRTTSFMTPKTKVEHLFRDAVLDLAPRAAFARALVNAGRLSRPCTLAGHVLQTPDAAPWDGPAPGTVCPDAPILDEAGRPGWLLNRLGGDFALLVFAEDAAELAAMAARASCLGPPLVAIAPRSLQAPEGIVVLADPDGLARVRYAAEPGTTYLIRPDQHVAARFKSFDPGGIALALERAGGGVRPVRAAA
ncbi:FAD-dependent oxidoreductase [Enterovirga aerilata]|uniref:FAD-dependent oxidoreductase n=1 Tax=Enterovirga aerilata TaxID=2730920 RepID=A0A849HVG9_9HYPH|nr:FAD-dependent oxidoreductase [Enterovirga sp. DB1703]NNM71102.1 FAD-dependent oxidoreductase [Enterovirga sp. DB1703]